MKKLASTLPNMILSLGVITAAAGALLGGMYVITQEPIARQEAEQQVAAIREVAPPFDNDPEAEKVVYQVEGQDVTVYPAKIDGKLAGAAVKATSMNGFSGEITVMCGFDADGTVRDYRVLRQAETPGLGAKMEMWFRDPAGARSVIGRNPGVTSFFVTKDTEQHGEIDGITAATISSRAFLSIMRTAYDAYLRYQGKPVAEVAEASSGASKQQVEK